MPLVKHMGTEYISAARFFKMNLVSTSNCLCCGDGTPDYLEHLLETHKFNLKRAREVISASESSTMQNDTGSNSTLEATNSSDDLMGSSKSVLNIGGVPIKVPRRTTGGSVHIHLTVNRSETLNRNHEMEMIQAVTPLPPTLSSQEIDTSSTLTHGSSPSMPPALRPTTVLNNKTGTLSDSNSEPLNLSESVTTYFNSMATKDNTGDNIVKDLEECSSIILKKAPVKNKRTDSKQCKFADQTTRSAKARKLLPLQSENTTTNKRIKIAKHRPQDEKVARMNNASKKQEVMPLKLTNSSVEKLLLKYPPLDKLLKGQVHTCKICNEKIPICKQKINGHVVNKHGINAVQYLALFYMENKWYKVR